MMFIFSVAPSTYTTLNYVSHHFQLLTCLANAGKSKSETQFSLSIQTSIETPVSRPIHRSFNQVRVGETCLPFAVKIFPLYFLRILPSSLLVPLNVHLKIFFPSWNDNMNSICLSHVSFLIATLSFSFHLQICWSGNLNVGLFSQFLFTSQPIQF